MSTISFDLETPPVVENLLRETGGNQKTVVKKRTLFGALKRMISRINLLFLMTVILPTVLGGVYFGFIASDIYVSESRFVVRSISQKSSSSSGLRSLLHSAGGGAGGEAGFSGGSDDPYPVHDFMLSKDALWQLNDKLGLAQSFGSTKVDRIRRFGGLDPDASFEALHRYYLNRVTVDVDSTSSIAIVQVEAFNPEEAYRINTMLLEMGEQLVNQLNERAQKDLIGFASTQVAQAEARAKDAAVALSKFRVAKGVFDPTHQSGLELQEGARMQSDLAGAKTQLAQLLVASPNSPSIPVLRERIRSLGAEIQAGNAKVTGSGQSFSVDAAEYERLALDVKYADQHVASAMEMLDHARFDAMRQQLYLERIAQPNKPDLAPPRRLRSFCAVFILGMLSWGILALLFAGLREHHA